MVFLKEIFPDHVFKLLLDLFTLLIDLTERVEMTYGNCITRVLHLIAHLH